MLKLYHAVFDNYQDVIILDCNLQPVSGGKMRVSPFVILLYINSEQFQSFYIISLHLRSNNLSAWQYLHTRLAPRPVLIEFNLSRRSPVSWYTCLLSPLQLLPTARQVPSSYVASNPTALLPQCNPRQTPYRIDIAIAYHDLRLR